MSLTVDVRNLSNFVCTFVCDVHVNAAVFAFEIVHVCRHTRRRMKCTRKRFESTLCRPCHRFPVTSTTTHYTLHDNHSRDPHGHPSAQTFAHLHTIIVKLLPFVRVCLNSHHADMKKHCAAITMRSTPSQTIAKKKHGVKKGASSQCDQQFFKNS